MDETECWGNDLEQIYDFETIEGCIAFCDGVHNSDALTFLPSETGCYCKNGGCANATPRVIEDAGSKIVSARKLAGDDTVAIKDFHTFLASHHDQKIDAVINGWNVMNEVDCWGNDIVQSHDLQTVEQCIAYWNWLISFTFFNIFVYDLVNQNKVRMSQRLML